MVPKLRTVAKNFEFNFLNDISKRLNKKFFATLVEERS